MHLQKSTFHLSILIIAHIFLWTLLPALLRHNLPLDTLEAIAWGKEWQFGYHKHPPLSAWVSQINSLIFHRAAWTFYFLSQITVAISFFIIWKIAQLFLAPKQAFMATILSAAIYYYNLTAVEFNPNVLLLPLWAITILNCYQAFIHNRLHNWILLGIFAGLSILTKYHTIFILAPIVITFFYQPKFRSALKTINPYIAVFLFITIIAPHIYWLYANNFSSIIYGLARAQSDDYHFYNHFSFALGFLLSQTLCLLGAILIFFLSFRHATKMKRINFKEDEKLSFLFLVGFGPFILITLYSIVTAAKLKDMWGTEFWNLFTIFLFYLWQPNLDEKNCRKFYRALLAIIFLYVAIYIGGALSFSKRADFDGKLAAEIITQKWHENNQKPLEIVGGEIWLSSNIAFYSKDSPHIFIDMSNQKSPWVSFADLKNKGEIIVWNATEEGENLPARFKEECQKTSNDCDKIFQNIKAQPPISIPWKSFISNSKPPYQLGLAIINGEEN